MHAKLLQEQAQIMAQAANQMKEVAETAQRANAHQKDQLGALINHIHALSKLINKKIQ